MWSWISKPMFPVSEKPVFYHSYCISRLFPRFLLPWLYMGCRTQQFFSQFLLMSKDLSVHVALKNIRPVSYSNTLAAQISLCPHLDTDIERILQIWNSCPYLPFSPWSGTILEKSKRAESIFFAKFWRSVLRRFSGCWVRQGFLCHASGLLGHTEEGFCKVGCFLISILQCFLSSTLGFDCHTLSTLVLSPHSAEGVLAELAMKFPVFSVH